MKDETQIYRDINRGRTASTGSKREDPGISDQTRPNTVKTGWNTREPRVDIQYKSALCWRDDLRRFDMLSQSHWSLSVLLFQHAPWTVREYPLLFLHSYFDDCPRNGYQRLRLDHVLIFSYKLRHICCMKSCCFCYLVGFGPFGTKFQRFQSGFRLFILIFLAFLLYRFYFFLTK